MQTLQNVASDVRAAAKFYRPELDVIRFLAFLLVFLHHALPKVLQPKSYQHHAMLAANVYTSLIDTFGFGLCLFFFLSAYLITELLLRERIRIGTVQIKSFYQRRILRIWPLYFLGIAIGLVIALATHATADVKGLLLYLVMLGNWYAVRHGWMLNPMSPLWSISVEEQFYLIWPMLIKLAGELGAWVGSVVFAVVSFVVTLHLANAGAKTDYEIWANSFVQFLMFAGGTIFALVLKGKSPSPPNWLRCIFLLAAFALWFFAVFALKTKTLDRAPAGLDVPFGYVLVVIGCALICTAFLGATVKMPTVLVNLGKISYGLYVFHALAVDASNELPLHSILLRRLCALVLTIFLAAISYRYFETPFLRMKDKRAFVQTRPE